MSAKCDFCSSPDVRWAFPARDFTHQREVTAIAASAVAVVFGDVDLTINSGGAWAACPACKALIVNGLRDKLLNRSAKRMRSGSLSLRATRDLIRPLHDQFWANRLGEPVPTTPDRPDPT